MLTLKNLIEMTPPEIQRRGKTVSMAVKSSVLDEDDNGVFKKVIVKALATTIPRIITFKLYQVKGKKFTINSPTWVHCSCENYLYQWEVSNTARGSSSVINSNGAMPRIKNPRLRPGLCKHSYAAALAALKSITKDVPIKEDIKKTTRKINKIIEKPKVADKNKKVLKNIPKDINKNKK
jgi:hypothetical protein